ncbi:putative GABA permease [Aspergillus novofumigatus IBT 16806]|uniref:Putative choline transporter n=1 Tax=Aspergillus novofumigatus (strain IBT 16806) TaxID=1392255 RepID=A0A2I1BXG7_ASPN1|nr:putative choline transporter [Aspergillus novofumigatus IBT 16806]PKX90083.1 putative choline transporter [Aspergillus novofumigatus IBT 16806]
MEIPKSENILVTPHVQLAKNFSFISLLGLAFATLNSWSAFASSLPLSLSSGGPLSIIWGLLAAGICTLCISISLAEILSAYPTAAGQYQWVAVSWDEYKEVLAWFTAWFNVAAWICLPATASLFGSSLIMNIAVLANPNLTVQPWQVFLVYIGFCLTGFLINAFWNSILAALSKAALIWSLCGFLIFSITALACAVPDYNSATYVFTQFINETGWPDGVAWPLGLLQGSLCLIGFDAVAHMIEEIPNPSVQGPRVMVACVAIGALTSFAFIIVLLFVSDDINTIITSGYGPLLQIILDATKSKAGAICLLLFPIICLLMGIVAIMTTSSRMILALGRDSGMPFSPFWTRVHPTLGTPLNALGLTAFLTLCCGCIYLGSSTAFNALSSATVVCFDISYGFPIIIHCLRGRNQLPKSHWTLSPVIGWTVNLVAIGYILLTTVLFLFPPSLPVTGRSMNYGVVVIGIVLIISTAYWLVRGRKRFSRQHVLSAEEDTTTVTDSTHIAVK